MEKQQFHLQKQYDYLVFIGRFQPFHNGHQHVVKKALSLADKVILLCGSAFRPRTIRNPFSYDERRGMISACFSESENKRIIFRPVMDVTYDDNLWVKNVKEIVSDLVLQISKNDRLSANQRIGLIGHKKDHTSFYLKLFPEWGFVSVENFRRINSTDIRDHCFMKRGALSMLAASLPTPIIEFLDIFSRSDGYNYLSSEAEFITSSESCGDSAGVQLVLNVIVESSGKLLLYKRSEQPGVGLYALPEGSVAEGKRLLASAIDIAKSVLPMGVSDDVLYESFRLKDVFDSPKRSELGRVISHVFYFGLPDGAADDASPPAVSSNYEWITIDSLDSEIMYQDHFFILRKCLVFE